MRFRRGSRRWNCSLIVSQGPKRGSKMVRSGSYLKANDQLDYLNRQPRGYWFQVAKRSIFATWSLWHQGEQHGGQRCQKEAKSVISESTERPAKSKMVPVELKFQVAKRTLFATWNLSAQDAGNVSNRGGKEMLKTWASTNQTMPQTRPACLAAQWRIYYIIRWYHIIQRLYVYTTYT